MSADEINEIKAELRALRARVERLTWVLIAVLAGAGFDVVRPLLGV